MAGCHQKAVLDPFLGSMPLTLLNALPFTVFVCTEQPLFSTLRIQFLSVCTEQPLFLSLPYTVFVYLYRATPLLNTSVHSFLSVCTEQPLFSNHSKKLQKCLRRGVVFALGVRVVHSPLVCVGYYEKDVKRSVIGHIFGYIVSRM